MVVTSVWVVPALHFFHLITFIQPDMKIKQLNCLPSYKPAGQINTKYQRLARRMCRCVSVQYANVWYKHSPKPTDHNYRLGIMEMCSKARWYLFIDLICYSCSDLLIAAFVLRGLLCFCCCPLAVCLNQLGLILQGVDWTLQMSAYNLLIPFISGCCCWCLRACTCACVCTRVCLSKTDGGGWLCWKWVDLIYTGLFARQGRRGAPHAFCCLSVSFPFLSLSLFSHICS